MHLFSAYSISLCSVFKNYTVHFPKKKNQVSLKDRNSPGSEYLDGIQSPEKSETRS